MSTLGTTTSPAPQNASESVGHTITITTPYDRIADAVKWYEAGYTRDGSHKAVAALADLGINLADIAAAALLFDADEQELDDRARQGIADLVRKGFDPQTLAKAAAQQLMLAQRAEVGE